MNYYRKNKFGENVEVEKYTCGTCKFYEFEREDKENYCKSYCHYYPMSDKCNRWEEYTQESSGGCFLTTCCCVYKGLEDDCDELETLRKFRDEVLMTSRSGKALVEQYYSIAPSIVNELQQHAERETIQEELYSDILEIVNLIKNREDVEAISKYVVMLFRIERKLLINQ